VVSPGTEVTLDGSESQDPEGENLTFLWEQTSGPEEVSLNGGTTPRPSFTPGQQGVYVFRLVVNDGTYNSAPDFTEVQVEAGAEGCGCSAGADGGLASLALLMLLGMLVRWGRRS
jgi:MYXO-CTERM domain-containing protein